MKPLILFKRDEQSEKEWESANKYFDVYTNIDKIPPSSLVIARYSALPFYQEKELDLLNRNSKFINLYYRHLFISHIHNWHILLKNFTPETWFSLDQAPQDGAFVVKGTVNSRKHDWNAKMFAPNRERLEKLVAKMTEDPLISGQGYCIRRYLPLKKLDEGPGGLPISNEWRHFYLLTGADDFPKINKIAHGFYWGKYSTKKGSENTALAGAIAYKVARTLSYGETCFVAIDVAQLEDGSWTLIEIGDAQMAGLSDIKPDEFYKSLSHIMGDYDVHRKQS
jgi:hypothetical protein